MYSSKNVSTNVHFINSYTNVKHTQRLSYTSEILCSCFFSPFLKIIWPKTFVGHWFSLWKRHEFMAQIFDKFLLVLSEIISDLSRFCKRSQPKNWFRVIANIILTRSHLWQPKESCWRLLENGETKCLQSR